MKKNLLAFNLFLYILLSFSAVKADYIRLPTNPILQGSMPYDIEGTHSSAILKINNEFKMYYSGFNGIVTTINLATSNNGIDWVKSNKNPLIIPDANNTFICEKSAFAPDVIFDIDEQLFKMWYTVDCEPKSNGVPRYWIKYAYSTDGDTWNIEKKPVISPAFSWDRELVAQPTVIKLNNKYEMWFSARNNSGKNVIGYASSFDGINWERQPEPVLMADQPWEYMSIASPEIYFKDNTYHLFYHSDGGAGPVSIVYATSTDGIHWTKNEHNPLIYPNDEETKLHSPDFINYQQVNYLYYTNLSNGKWQVSLATENLPKPKIKYVIVPGFFGSWNKDAILHNSSDGEWKLNPMVRDYDGMIQTFKNLGLKENIDFFIYAYDWRSSIEETADKFNIFINTITTDKSKVDIIGHSLGGLVSRIYAQKYGIQKINTLITLGSPHLGTAKVYKPIEAGEIERENTFMWMMEKFIININRKAFNSDKEILINFLPVLRDLLPIFNFLEINGTEIDINSMNLKNNTLLKYQTSIESIFSILQTFVGEGGDTLKGYIVEQTNSIDKLLGNYVDGKPIGSLYEIGDYTILSISAKLDTDFVTKKMGHGELIFKKEAIKEILNRLNLSIDESEIIEGKPTSISPSLIFAIKSPAKMTVLYKDKIYQEKDGLIFIPDAEKGEYTIQAHGIDKGSYEIVIGKIFENNDTWENINGEITSDNPAEEIDTYNISFTEPTNSPTPRIEILSANAKKEEVKSGNADAINDNKLSKSPKLLRSLKELKGLNNRVQDKVLGITNDVEPVIKKSKNILPIVIISTFLGIVAVCFTRLFGR